MLRIEFIVIMLSAKFIYALEKIKYVLLYFIDPVGPIAIVNIIIEIFVQFGGQGITQVDITAAISAIIVTVLFRNRKIVPTQDTGGHG